MPVEYKDYYQTLEVPSDASQDDIKKAFRRLSRKFHPDVAANKADAERKFKDINEAYQVLKDPEKRRKYDRLGENWEQADFAAQAGGGTRAGAGPGRDFRWQSGTGPFAREETFHFGGTGFSDFFETFFGSMGGEDPIGGDFTAGGRSRDRTGRDVEADIMVTLEEALHGSTRQITLRREGPEGKAGQPETYQVKIPPGVSDGQRIRLAGQGEPGLGRGRAGHLFLKVCFAAHPDFRVQGKDLHYDLPLAPWEAVLGSRQKVPTLTRPVTMTIPPGTQNGRKFRLRGHGLPGKGGLRGDLYVRAEIRIPTETTGRARELWEKLAQTSNYDPRNEK